MSVNLSFIIKSFLSLILGILFGIVVIFFLPKVSPVTTNKLAQIFEKNKPQIIGFAPYWLLPKAVESHEKYLNVFTYFGLTMDIDGTIRKLLNPQEEEPGWTTLKSKNFQEKLKQIKAKKIKTSLLLHLSNEATISALLEQPVSHAQNLISDVAPVMQKHGFTDLNLDIESFKEASGAAQLQFTTFIREVKKQINAKKLGTLTVEIAPIALVASRLANAKEIGKIADYLVLMAYDFHFSGSYISGAVAPMGGGGKREEFDIKISLDEMMKTVPKEKIILGIPLYGYEWETISDNPNAPVIPATGATASNRRVADLIKSCVNCISGFDEIAKAPYLIFPKDNVFHQIYYENEKSALSKLQLVKENKLAGAAFWALGYESELFDFNSALRVID